MFLDKKKLLKNFQIKIKYLFNNFHIFALNNNKKGKLIKFDLKKKEKITI